MKKKKKKPRLAQYFIICGNQDIINNTVCVRMRALARAPMCVCVC